MESDLRKLRKDYSLHALNEGDVAKDPFTQFKTWLTEAIASQFVEPNAMILATSSADGMPSARVVLLKDYDEQGLVFFTNYRSRKGVELEANPKAALLFYWAELERQIRIEGRVEKVSRAQSEAYFSKRPRTAQIGAHASFQSSVLTGREVLEREAQRLEKFWQGKDVACPKDWGGFRLRPECFEFWQGRESRLHDRICYRKTVDVWRIERLAP